MPFTSVGTVLVKASAALVVAQVKLAWRRRCA